MARVDVRPMQSPSTQLFLFYLSNSSLQRKHKAPRASVKWLEAPSLLLSFRAYNMPTVSIITASTCRKQVQTIHNVNIPLPHKRCVFVCVVGWGRPCAINVLVSRHHKPLQHPHYYTPPVRWH